MKFQKKPVIQEFRRAEVGETIISSSGPQVVPEKHVVCLGSPDDSWPVSFEYLIENCEPVDDEAREFVDEINRTTAVREE